MVVLPEPCKPDQHDHDRRRRFEIELMKVATKQADHFVANDLDELLLRREALQHFLTHRFGFDRVEESLDDFNVDIGFE